MTSKLVTIKVLHENVKYDEQVNPATICRIYHVPKHPDGVYTISLVNGDTITVPKESVALLQDA